MKTRTGPIAKLEEGWLSKWEVQVQFPAACGTNWVWWYTQVTLPTKEVETKA